MTKLDSILKSRDITLPTKVHLVKAMVFPVVMYGCELDYKESWALKNWCFWTVVLEKNLKSPLDRKEIQPVNPTGNQSWIFIGRTDTEAEPPILWPPDVKNWFIGKDPDAAKDWRQEEKWMTRDGDGWMPSPTQWTCFLASSRNWWWTGKPGVLLSMGLQRVRHDWATELNWMKGDKNIVEGGGCCFSVAQSCPTLCDPMDYCMPGSSIHGILQARVLEWVAIAFS